LEPDTRYEVHLFKSLKGRRVPIYLDKDDVANGNHRGFVVRTDSLPVMAGSGSEDRRDRDVGPKKFRVFAVSCNRRDVSESRRSAWSSLGRLVQEVSADAGVDGPPVVVHMGDQIYGDSAFRKVAERLSATAQIPGRRFLARLFGRLAPQAPDGPERWIRAKQLATEVYSDVYRAAWRNDEIPAGLRAVFQQASNLMIWDDHDVTDDWGGDESQRSRGSLAEAAGSVARQAYYRYQGQLKAFSQPTSPDHEGSIHEYGEVGIVLLDVRGGRTWGRSPVCRMLGDHQWEDLLTFLGGESVEGLDQADTEDWQMGGVAPGPRVLVVCSPVPFVLVSPAAARAASKAINDTRDQWTTQEHLPELVFLLRTLARWKQSTDDREVILISGDAHVGLLSTITVTLPAVDGQPSLDVEMSQVVSSPIAGDIAPRVFRAALTALNKDPKLADIRKRLAPLAALGIIKNRPVLSSLLTGEQLIAGGIRCEGSDLVDRCNFADIAITVPHHGRPTVLASLRH
jgi:hypothetical protein